MTTSSTSAAAEWRRGLIARKRLLLDGSPAKEDDAPGLVVAVGNSAGDLDSIVSALAAAHLFQGVAMAPFRAADLALRRDAAAALRHCGLDADAPPEFLYLDDLAQRTARGLHHLTGLALTDHNVADRALVATLTNQSTADGPTEQTTHDDDDDDESRRLLLPVVAILDHHADAGAHRDAGVRDVDPAAGSACTLLAERLLDTRRRGTPPPPAELLGLLACGVALDTRGFDAKQRKYSDRDVRAMHALLDALGAAGRPEAAQEEASDGAQDRSAASARSRRLAPSLLASFRGGCATVKDLADALGAARHDVADLTAAQLLRMDYKQAATPGRADAPSVRLGVAGCLVPLTALRARVETAGERFDDLLEALATEKGGLDVVVVMTAADAAYAPKRKGILYKEILRGTPSSSSSDDDDADRRRGRRLEAALEAVPANLPAHLAELPLFESQGILDRGFDVDFGDLAGSTGGPGGVRFSLLPKEITRKTMLPTLLHFLAIDDDDHRCRPGRGPAGASSSSSSSTRDAEGRPR